jgi:hypothetical protein
MHAALQENASVRLARPAAAAVPVSVLLRASCLLQPELPASPSPMMLCMALTWSNMSLPAVKRPGQIRIQAATCPIHKKEPLIGQISPYKRRGVAISVGILPVVARVFMRGMRPCYVPSGARARYLRRHSGSLHASSANMHASEYSHARHQHARCRWMEGLACTQLKRASRPCACPNLRLCPCAWSLMHDETTPA